jgi:hypothetical protein
MSSIQNISLYIPHVFANYSKDDVAQVFEKLYIGKVSRVDFVAKHGQDGSDYNAAYIHFDYWCNNSAAFNFQERVLNPKKEARLVYEDPWYWIVLENKGKKVVPGQPKTRIDLGEFTAINNNNCCPLAPKKPVLKRNKTITIQPTNLNASFDEAIDLEDEPVMNKLFDEACMWECEQAMAEDDHFLRSFDYRYVQSLEHENHVLRNQVAWWNTYGTQALYVSQATANAESKLHSD